MEVRLLNKSKIIDIIKIININTKLLFLFNT